MLGPIEVRRDPTIPAEQRFDTYAAMMRTRVRLNPSAIRKLGDQAVAASIRRTQPEVDRLQEECQGRPAAEVKVRLRQLLDFAGITGLSERQLDEHARRLSIGERVVLVQPSVP